MQGGWWAAALLLVASVASSVVAGTAPGGAASAPIATPQWSIQQNGNSNASAYEDAAGVRHMDALPRATQLDFPYASADAFLPPSGPYTLTFTITYERLRGSGDGVLFLDDQAHPVAWVWGDSETGIHAGVDGFHWSSVWGSQQAAVHGTPAILLGETAGPHEIRLSVRDGNTTLWVDGTFRVGSALAHRPWTAWAGHPTVGQLAGLLPDGTSPVRNGTDASGVVAKRWWAVGEDQWTSFTLSPFAILEDAPVAVAAPCGPEVCCPVGAAADTTGAVAAPVMAPPPAEATPAESPDQTWTSPPPMAAPTAEANDTVALDGTGCVTVHAGIAHVEADIAPGSQASIHVGPASITYDSDLGTRLEADVGSAATLPELATLPDPLPAAADRLPEIDGARYTLVTAVQVHAAAPPDVTSVRIDIPAPAGAQPDGGYALLYWDGSQWQDTAAFVGRTIPGHGEPDLNVTSVQADAHGVTAVVAHTSTYALAAKPVASASGRSVPWPYVILGILILANVALVVLDVALFRQRAKARRKS